MHETYNVFVINPGSTSTKLSFFKNRQEVCTETVSHDAERLQQYQSVAAQTSFRQEILETFLNDNRIRFRHIHAVVGRGGLLKPIPSGTYRVNPEMIQDLVEAKYGEHASNLGAVLADRIARKAGCPAYIVDPVVVDEMQPVARLSGHPMFQRKSIFHALNQKAVARQAAEMLGKSYQDCRLIVTHLGGGISVGAHVNGRVVDVNNALDGEGPFSPERAGSVPAGDLIGLCFSGKLEEKKIRKMLVGSGGLIAYLGTHNLKEILERIKTENSETERVLHAMGYQVCKEIGALAAVMQGDVDAIVITGGIAFAKEFTDMIQQYVSWISRIIVIPGEAEMDALAAGAYRILMNEEEEREYN